MRIFNSVFLGRNYYKFQLGYAPIGYFLGLIGFLTFAKVWQSTFEYYGIPFILVVVCTPLIVIGAAWVLGDLQLRFKIQEELVSLSNTEGNKELTGLCKKIDAIIRYMDIEIEEK